LKASKEVEVGSSLLFKTKGKTGETKHEISSEINVLACLSI